MKRPLVSLPQVVYFYCVYIKVTAEILDIQRGAWPINWFKPAIRIRFSLPHVSVNDRRSVLEFKVIRFRVFPLFLVFLDF